METLQINILTMPPHLGSTFTMNITELIPELQDFN